jgi:hypothetical protein
MAALAVEPVPEEQRVAETLLLLLQAKEITAALERQMLGQPFTKAAVVAALVLLGQMLQRQ